MSKLNITTLVDSDMTVAMLSGLTDAYLAVNKVFPETLIITNDQAKKFFFEAGQVVNNFKGIPLEIEAEVKANYRQATLNTINGILKGMHTARTQTATDVYSMLEDMKNKFEELK